MAENVFKYKIAANIFDAGDQAVNATIAKVKQLDDDMTQTRLVTGQSAAEAQVLIGSYANLAIQLHTTTAAVSEGSVEWLFNRGHYKFL